METITEEKRTKKPFVRELIEWIITLAAAVVLALLIRTFIFEPYRVIGSSMLETLHDGEMMFTTKYDYLLGEPERFDVVICRYPDRTDNFVKRLVGLPGDTVAVRSGVLYIDGEPQDEAYIVYPASYNVAEHTLGEGEYYVLGDNRVNSNDSHILGPLSRDQIKAHVRAVWWPLSAMRTIQ